MMAVRISRSQNTHSKSAKRNTETWDGPLGVMCWPGKTHLCLLEVSSALGRQPHGTNCRLSRRLSTVTALRCTTWKPGATPPLCRSLGKDNFFFLGGKTLKHFYLSMNVQPHRNTNHEVWTGPFPTEGRYQEEAKQHQCGQHKQDQTDDFALEFKVFAQRVMDRTPRLPK